MSSQFQRFIDELWDKYLLKIIPKSITPNHFTILRFVLIPVVLFFLVTGQFFLSLLFFLLASLTDSIDGSLARRRNMVSEYGIMLDPMADKLLVILLSLFLFFYYPYFQLLLILVIIDVLILIQSFALVVIRHDISTPPANWTGKSKMVFQILSLLIIMFYLMSGSLALLGVSLIFIYLAIFTGILSLFSYGMRAFSILIKGE